MYRGGRLATGDWPYVVRAGISHQFRYGRVALHCADPLDSHVRHPDPTRIH